MKKYPFSIIFVVPDGIQEGQDPLLLMCIIVFMSSFKKLSFAESLSGGSAGDL